MMKTACPIDGNVGEVSVQFHRTGQRTTGRQLTEVIETIEDRTIFSDID